MLFPEYFESFSIEANRHLASTGKPLVTLSYAQSLDGSLSHVRGEPLALSGPESMAFTHQVRQVNDAILVGIGTVLADNPRLTARGVQGADPQPVVLDSSLRLQPDSQLWSHPLKPWIFTGPDSNPGSRREAESRGGRIFPTDLAGPGLVDLNAVLDSLAGEGIASLMVEGGAEVITNFLRLGLVDRAAITISPSFIGGLRVLDHALNTMPSLIDINVIQAGKDIILTGKFDHG